ncbi:MAG: DUF5696 domain-containing protein [Bacilli bacterium]|jgi:hypothetical protein
MTLKWPKFLTFKRTLLITLLLILLIVGLVFVLGGYKPAKPVLSAKDFSFEGFTEFKSFTEQDKQVQTVTSENGRFVFKFDPVTTYFSIEDKVTGHTWYSNPTEEDEFETNKGTVESQKSTLILEYITPVGGTNTFANYTYSIYDFNEEQTEGGYNLDLAPTFSVKYEGNKVTVLYELVKKGIDYTFFPARISQERLEHFIDENKRMVEEGVPGVVELDNRDLNRLKITYYELDEKTEPDRPFYKLKKAHENMSGLEIQNLYRILYVNCGYTREDAAYDNAMYGVSINMDRPHFSIAIEYEVSNEGLKVTVPAKSIIERGSQKIGKVKILPYFTTAKRGTEGYMVIPDGSGAVMNFDNDKLAYGGFGKRVYGRDTSYYDEIKPVPTEDVLLPMYGLVNKTADTGVVVTADNGATMLNLYADISGRIDSYNRISYEAFLREAQTVWIGLGAAAKPHVKWTEDRLLNDVELNYHFLEAKDNNYNDMAKFYRRYLGLEDNDKTTSTVLNLELIGSYDYDTNFLGIGYTAYDSLTTYKQAMEIIEEMRGHGAEYINVLYRGWQEDGLTNPSISKLSLSKVIGGKKGLKEFVEYTKNNNINFYPYLSFSEFTSFNESFGRQHYSSRTVGNDFSYRYPYNPSFGIFDMNLDEIMVVSPKYYTTFMSKFIKEFNKKVGINSVAFEFLGSSLGGDYKKRQLFYKESAMIEQIQSLQMAKENGIDNINLFTPYQYALPYVSNALEVPYTSTSYEILDYSIPFYQLVVSGSFDYSGMSYNANDEKGMMYHLMRMLETGSNVQFTFSYEDSAKLIQTKYNNYYYTQYSKWLSEVDFLVNSLNELKIHEGVLVQHEQLANDIFRVKYSNGIEFILNYTERVLNNNLSSYGVVRGNLIERIDLGLGLEKEVYERAEIINNIVDGNIKNQIIIYRSGGAR